MDMTRPQSRRRRLQKKLSRGGAYTAHPMLCRAGKLIRPLCEGSALQGPFRLPRTPSTGGQTPEGLLNGQ